MDSVWVIEEPSYGEITVKFTDKTMQEQLEEIADSFTPNHQVYKVSDNLYVVNYDFLDDSETFDPEDDPNAIATRHFNNEK